MRKLIVKAPAKINLYLRVCKKRPDGYHDIDTIFEKIGLYDTIALKKRKKGIKISCNKSNVPRNGGNLGYKAARAIFQETGCPGGVEIHIDKKIPVAAGLGGGSSDAASVLTGLNRLYRLRLPQKRLLAIAEGIGADVPLFIMPSVRMRGRGKGEILTSIQPKRRYWYILVVPKGMHFSTKAMYQHPKITLTKPPYGATIMLRALNNKSDLTAFSKYSYNSFEEILQNRYRDISEIKKALISYGAYATLMSGSGPCVFGVTSSRKEAVAISTGVRRRHKKWHVVVARTYSKSKRRK